MIAKMAAPVTASELQLYRVLQRANLLQYYETFIAQGGDDVQQLCEAGEEEFLEIMALVGMASKPLHVRRLQKALQEWVTNPAVFQQPLVAAKSAIAKVSPTASMPPSVQRAPQVVSYTSVSPVGSVWTPPTVASIESASREAISLIRSTSPNGDSRDGSSPSHSNHANTIVIDASQHMDAAKLHGGKRSPGPHSGSHTMLSDTQIQAIKDAAEALVKTLPPYAPKPMNMRKEICRDIERVMNMDRDDPARPDQIYKYSAIYGRFDSKRKNDKPMSLHEISVNEAAAQICMQMSSLLTRRDELFPLARDVVRDSGYQYSKGHSSRAASADPPSLSTPAKKAKLDHDAGDHSKTPRAEMERMQREARLAGIKEELVVVAQTQEQLKSEVQAAKAEENYNLIHQLQSQLEELTSKHLGLLTEESDLTRKQKRALKSQRYMMSKAGTPLPMEETDSGLASGGASPANGLQDASDIYAALKNNNTSQFTKDSLFNEGLRIAQQYGMADFAEELKGMQPTEEEVDEQSEWNREVEKDAEQSAVSSEQAAVSAEQSAVSAEQAAVSAEQAAVSAEQAAVSASNNNGKHDDSNDTVTNGNIVKTETTTEIVETAS